MYSPKIAEELIPVLYHIAKARSLPMTRLVDRIIREALVREDLPSAAQEAIKACSAPPMKPQPTA